ncbi:MAG: hypothetical protein ACE363_15385 [Alphaproteobacteria bacterium]
MDIFIEQLLPLAETVAIVFGVIFAAVQLRQFRMTRHHEAISEVVRSFQTPEFIRAMATVYRMDPNARPRDALENAELTGEIHLFGQTVETIGVLVHRRHVPIDIVDDIYGDVLILCWKKLKPHTESNRRIEKNPAAFEWFEWLVDRLAERHARETGHDRTPAFLQHKNWKERSS